MKPFAEPFAQPLQEGFPKGIPNYPSPFTLHPQTQGYVHRSTHVNDLGYQLAQLPGNTHQTARGDDHERSGS